MKTTFEQGLKAEETARHYLENKGYKTLAVRYRTPYGEIDLVMQDADTIVAVEVKYRKSSEDCHYSLTTKQQLRISNALLHFIQNMKQNPNIHQDAQALRCDVILLSHGTDIIHYENAWQ